MRCVVTAAVLFVFTVSCGPLDEGEAGAVASQAQELRRDDDGIIIMNGLSPSELGENLLLNNEINRAQLIANPLSSASFVGGTASAVRYDPRAARVLGYLVRCALSPSDPPVTVAGKTYAGQLSLCRAWATGGIVGNVGCERQVSACLLGLSNVVGAHVPVSMRGNQLALSAAASVAPYPYTSNGAQHAALNPCEAASAGAASPCGWQPVDDSAARATGIGSVFACVPGAEVRVGAGSSCDGVSLGTMAPGSDKVLRVCADIGPCFGAGDPALLGQAEDSCNHTSIKPEVRFTCPGSGRYTVMQRDYSLPARGASVGTMVVGQLNSLGPAPERTVFPIREGAFFGTILSGPLGRRVALSWSPTQTPILTTTVVPGAPVFGGAYSCEDAAWRDEVAYRTARLCTLSGSQCLSTRTGLCQGDATHAKVCSEVSGPTASGTFKGCSSPTGVRYDEALTTYLRGQCDLIGNSAACKQED